MHRVDAELAGAALTFGRDPEPPARQATFRKSTVAR